MVKTKFKSLAVGAASAALLVVAPLSATAMSNNNDNNGNDNEHNRITICHATGSTSNPYVRITVNANGIVHGHGGHQDGNDIIPSFTYNDHGTTATFPAQGDQSILANGCMVTGGQGGGQKDCDGDFDSSPQTECNTVTGPTTDCDGDTDSSPATECPATGQVLAANTANGGQGAVSTQVTTVPQGSVNGGGGAASKVVNSASAVGLFGSLLSLGTGLALFNRKQS